MRKFFRVRTLKIILGICVVWLLIQSLFVYNYSRVLENGTITEDSYKGENSDGIFRRFLNQFIDLGHGEQGRAVVIPDDRKEEAKKLFKVHQFNVMASDMMSLNRSLPDYRMSACQSKDYPKKLPNTSIIIVFHNEAWSTLLRTVHSAINRSPKKLIHEIIMVDDASTFEHLKKPLDEYVTKLSVSIKILRMASRTGLIRARLHGASEATGETLLFLDAHCESTIGWLEPLLHEIKVDKRTIVAPVIDVISEDDFEYVTASDMTWGGFNWKMNFKWNPVPERENIRRNGDHSKPLYTPTIAGGLFAIDRKFFYELGAYDEGMEIWGAENLEISFRTWMCHGRLLIATCSRVGHVFRKTSPYSWPGGVDRIINKNIMRTVLVWLDQYKDLYLKYNRGVRNTDYGDISDRLELRKKNKCKSFDWYLKHIYPESNFGRPTISLGLIHHNLTKLCLDTMDKKADSDVGIYGCHNQGGNQMWAFTIEGNIMSDELCLDGSGSRNSAVKMINCDFTAVEQRFRYEAQTKIIQSSYKGLCLSYSFGSLSVILDICKKSSEQEWTLQTL